MVKPEVVVDEGEQTGHDENGVCELDVRELPEVQVVDVVGEKGEERQLERKSVEEVQEDEDGGDNEN
mgnify:CR=1 FL=1